MSTSPRLAAPTPPGSPAQPFLYAEAEKALDPAAEAVASAALHEDGTRRLQAAREAGRQEGEASARTDFERQLVSIRESMKVTLADFGRERKAYFQQVEAEVVALALSIARKVLHREAQVDPLLLAGLVRVALEQMAGGQVVVRVCPQQLAEYRGFFSRHMAAEAVPQVEEDAELEPDHCRLQTSMGTTELGVESQLKEIERGLLDLLAQRPEVGG
jgi:flagellar assembly protein FliH